MKINFRFLDLVIKVIILLIFLVVLFIISTVLYSARYWPDIYNYLNANITITRIPKLSELNLTRIEVDYVTEMYSTTDFDYTESTIDIGDEFSFDEFDIPNSKIRRSAKLEHMGTDNSDVLKTVVVDHFFDDETSTKVIKDLVDESKLTTRRSEDVEIMVYGDSLEVQRNMNFHRKQPTLSSLVFPWVAAIFLKNDSKGSQFDYFCDGAIINDRAILTAARCVRNGNDTYNDESFIVILGKTSLQVSGGDERILRVKSVRVHENFDENGDAENDLAVLFLEEPIIFNGAISPANWTDGETHEEDGDTSEALTTAWSLRGDLTLIYFDKAKSKVCGTDNKVKNTLCATYGDAVALCPSYGGLYVTKRTDKLYLNGIRTGNPLQRGICFSKDVSYTSLHNYTEWIRDTVENKYV